MEGRVLLVDREDCLGSSLDWPFKASGFSLLRESSVDAALSRLLDDEVDLAIVDIGDGRDEQLELCRRIPEIRPQLPVLVIASRPEVELVVAALRVGASDFVPRPLDVRALLARVERIVTRQRQRARLRRLERAQPEVPRYGLVGRSAAMQRVLELVRRVADTEATVLLCGESGTGKELVARALHAGSRRCEAPFVALNCAAVPASLLEAELFGYVPGAFTDGRSGRTGLFLSANGGTLLLDEIGELPLELQPKLLRALQEGKVRPVGADTEVAFEARIVTATHRDLEAMVEHGEFREDLFYRLDVVRIDVPPLRVREGDVLLLAKHFLERHLEGSSRPVTGLSTAAIERLMAYDWPGNVRELENCIERAVALADAEEITVDDLPAKIRDHRPEEPLVDSGTPGSLPTLDELERRYIARVLAMLGGNKSQAAKVLGVDRRTLYRRLKRLGSPTARD